MTSREDAVSEAIGGVLLIALVLIGAAIIGTYITSQPLPEKIPKVQFSVKEVGDDIILEHQGGESLGQDAFHVLVDGENVDGDWVIEPDPGGTWSMGGRIRITGHGSSTGNSKSVGLVYSGGSGDTLLRHSSSPWGFNYAFPSYDEFESIELPDPWEHWDSSTWDPNQPSSWPPDRASIAASGDTVTFDPSKVAYVAAHDSTMTPSGQVLFVCDGVNDESEINQALSIMKGGTVYLLDGSFHCSGRISVPGHTRLSGQGSTETMVEVLAADGASGYLPVSLNQPDVTVEGFSLFGNGFVMVTTSHVRIRDITATSRELDKPTAMRRASGNGMFFVWATTADLQDIEFYNCKAIECNTHGFNMNQQWDIGGSDTQARTIGWVRFVGCTATLCGFGEPAGSRSEWITGFDFHEWQDLRNMWVIDCWAENNWESGFHLEPGGRYDENGDIIGARTISEEIYFENCTSKGNGQRNTNPGAFFMSGYYLSRNTTLTNCHSEDNLNAGYYVHGGQFSTFIRCTDINSTYGWKVCKASSDITLTDCSSSDNLRWALWLSFSQRISVMNFQQHDVAGDRGYQDMLGWYKDELKYQQPVTDSWFDITADGNGLPIINQAGSGNTYSLTYG
ncbi:MAG: type IV pilin N-terminal domain-containing protein [Methanospirillum sp.]